MKLNEVKSMEELKSIGSIKEIVQKINQKIEPLLVNADTYETLYNIVTTLQKKWIPFRTGPFLSKEEEYIYYLTKLEGKQRNKALRIEDKYYEDAKLAKTWRNEILHIVSPDKNAKYNDETKTNNANNAVIVLNKLYDVMTEKDI